MYRPVWKRGLTSFMISLMCGLLVNMLIEVIVQAVTGDASFSPLSPEFAALFQSETLAAEVNFLLYGLIGASFSAATAIYEKERIGYLLQTLLYSLATGIVWIPVVMLLWQLYRYPTALYSTLFCFFVTHVIMAVVGYRITQKDVRDINAALARQDL